LIPHTVHISLLLPAFAAGAIAALILIAYLGKESKVTNYTPDEEKIPIQSADFWKTCDHHWIGGLKRSNNHNGAEWRCSRCGAQYRFMCGHGGSLYVCDPCYKSVTDKMTKEAGTLKKYLDLHCFSPSIMTERRRLHV